MAEEKPCMIHFHEGDYLSAEEAGKVVRAAPTSVVVVAGVVDSGKTTLLAGLYGLFHKGPFADYIFAGCRTLPGFERRCHLARIDSGLTKPDTERTKVSDVQHLLHLRLADSSSLRNHDILFSDIYGEAFRRAADSADECKKFTILQRADHVAVLIDGEKAISKQDRQEAFASVDALLGQCLDTGMLGSTSSVQAVVTKWDVVAASAASNATFVDAKLRWLAERHRERLGRLASYKVAIRPSGGGDIKAGHGMADLLKFWVKVRARPRGMAKLNSHGVFHTEFDRLAASWPVAAVAEGSPDE